MDQPKREFSPEISISTSLVIAGTELIEMAGAITERGSANEHKLDRVAKAARKALAAVDEYHKRMDAARLEADPVINWPRPSYHRQAEGLRCEDVLPDDAA